MATTYLQIPSTGMSPYWANAVANFASLPTGTVDGEVALTLDDSSLYRWDAGSSTWVAVSASGSAITALTGDVSATGPGSAAATVNSVGGQTAADVAAGAVLANAATSANTNSAIVRRDGSGGVIVSTIAAVTSARIGSTGAATTDAALDVNTTTGAFMPPRMTSTERDALTGSNGMMIYNTTTDRFEGYAAGAWVMLHGWGS